MASEPISSTVKAVELGLRLRARRDQLGLTAAAVGRTTGIGGNNLSSIEIAKRRLTSTKLTELAGIYELSGDELAELDALRVQADRREWWDDYARLYSDDFLRFIGLEAGATVQQEYAAETIPGLLQTADYARAMILGGSPYIKPVDVGPRVESRLARQNRLNGANPPEFTVLIGQTALRQEVGSREVLAVRDHRGPAGPRARARHALSGRCPSGDRRQSQDFVLRVAMAAGHGVAGSRDHRKPHRETTGGR
jgi:transcriptional regulator with XRE-family HTH domain